MLRISLLIAVLIQSAFFGMRVSAAIYDSSTKELPQWFAFPIDGEYVGCSFPSEDTDTHHETAIVGAILNYIISNIDFNTIVKEDMSSSSDGETFNALSKRLFSLPVYIQLIRLEAIGKNTYVAIKVDTIEKKEKNYLCFNYQLGMNTTNGNTIEDTVIKLELAKDGEYLITEKTDDSRTLLTLFGQKSSITENMLGKTVDNYNNTVIKENNKIVAVKIPSFDKYGSPNDNVDCGLVFWQALIMELKQKVFNAEYMIEGAYLPTQHFRNTNNEIVDGNLFVTYKPIKK